MNNNVKVNIKGKNINNYIRWLVKNKINIINLNIVNHKELNIIIKYEDYKKLDKYSKTYKIKIIKKYGKLKILDEFKKNSIVLFSILISLILLYILSNTIFSIDIIYNDAEIIKKINNELIKYDIKKYHRKKSSEYLNTVKEKILNDNKDILEWIEIEESGTKYIVRLVERQKESIKKEYHYQSIVAKKDATITSIKAISGEKIKVLGEYIKKGQIVINGVLTKPNGEILYTKASGKIYGEVWYKVNIEYPLYYQEEKVTGKNKEVLFFYFLNKKIPLLPYKKYKQFKSHSKPLVVNNISPFGIYQEKLYEVTLKEDIYTPEEAISKAIDEAKQKLKNRNSDIIGIKETQILEQKNQNSKVTLTLFIATIEDITEIIEIIPESNTTNE